MRIIFLGAPGTGKGTQSALAAEHFHLPLLTTSDTLRAAINGRSTLGRQARAAMDTGQIVNDDIVLGIIEERLSEEDAGSGFVLDGYPRTQSQAESLELMLQDRGVKIDVVVLLSGDSEELMHRLVGRRTCRDCGSLFNTFTNPTMMDRQCDYCGSRLGHRPDDNEELVSSRLRFFETQTVLALEYYRQQGKLVEFNANLPVEQLRDQIQIKLTSVQQIKEKPQLADVKAVFDTIRQEQEATERAKREPLEPESPETEEPITHKPEHKAMTPKKASKRKTATKKRAAARKKVVGRKKVAAKRRVVKKRATRKKVAAKRRVVKRRVVKKRATRKKAAAKRRVVKRRVVKKRATRKKAAAKRRVVKRRVVKRRVVKKRATRKKVATKRRVVKRRVVKRRVVKKKAAPKRKRR